MSKPRPSAPIDPALAQIDKWHQWFVSAHTARIEALNLPPDQHDRELADVLRTASAVAERMKSDYLGRYQP